MAPLTLVASELVVAPLEIDPSCEIEENFGFLVGLLSAVFGLGVFLLMIDREGGGQNTSRGRGFLNVLFFICESQKT